jgi:hypothetical protein
MGNLYVLRKTKAMAQADRQQKTGPRLEIANVRVTATERAYLQQVASARSISVSDLLRTALRNEGALPAD